MSCFDVEKTSLWRDIKFNPVPIEEYFHIIDEIGRLVAAFLYDSDKIRPL